MDYRQATIGEIRANPEEYASQNIEVNGTVFPVGSGYRITDTDPDTPDEGVRILLGRQYTDPKPREVSVKGRFQRLPTSSPDLEFAVQAAETPSGAAVHTDDMDATLRNHLNYVLMAAHTTLLPATPQ